MAGLLNASCCGVPTWASGKVSPSEAKMSAWNASLLASNALVAVCDDAIAGFGDITDEGYLDPLFVHKGYQRIGVGAALCNALEALAPGDVTTHASITVLPFFETRGYERLGVNVVERGGERLTNYAMAKRRS